MKKFNPRLRTITFSILISISLLGFSGAPIVFFTHKIQIEPLDVVIIIISSLLTGGTPLAILRLSEIARVNACIVIISVIFSLYFTELAIQQSNYVTWIFYKAFRNDDTREKTRVITDMRDEGIPAYAAILPSSIKPFKVRGITIQVLSGLSNKTSVLCNEGLGYIVYQSDRYGFRNEDSVWDLKRHDIVAVGDSFIQGNCVPIGIVGHMRKVHSNTISLGSQGAGPLNMLGTMAEYLPRLKPRHILWFYFEGNDMSDLRTEIRRKSLLKYLEPNHRFDIPFLKKEIDKKLSVIHESMLAKRLKENRLNRVKTHVLPLKGLFDVLLLRNLRRALNLNFLGLDRSEGYFPPKGKIAEHEFKIFEAALRRAKILSTQHSAKIHFVYLPELWPISYRTMDKQSTRQRVISIANQAGIPIIDLHPQMSKMKLSDLFETGYGHFNDDGAKIVADLVLHALNKEIPLMKAE